MNPAVRLDEHVIPVNYPESLAPKSASIFMRTHVPLLFENGARNFDVCGKNIVLCNPLKANLAFTVSVEGPFLLKSAADVSSSQNETSSLVTRSTAMSSPKMGSSVSTMGRAFHLLPEVLNLYISD